MQQKLARLNTSFGINGTLTFTEKNGLPCALITNDLASAEVFLHGAHVASFTPKGGEDVLWMSASSYYGDSLPIRGGIPVCWPWFGAHPNDADKPSHGFARLTEWNLIETQALDNGATCLTLQISSDDATKQIWSYDFDLKLKVTVGSKLEVELITSNTDDEPFEITSALHSYFNISQIENVEISGLETTKYADSLDGRTIKQQDGIITFDQEVDRIYLDTEATCTIADSGKDRKILVEKCGSKSTVVWNPWIAKAQRMPDFGDDEYKTMVCVETTNAFTDSVTIQPGEKHSLKAILSVG